MFSILIILNYQQYHVPRCTALETGVYIKYNGWRILVTPISIQRGYNHLILNSYINLDCVPQTIRVSQEAQYAFFTFYWNSWYTNQFIFAMAKNVWFGVLVSYINKEYSNIQNNFTETIYFFSRKTWKWRVDWLSHAAWQMYFNRPYIKR